MLGSTAYGAVFSHMGSVFRDIRNKTPNPFGKVRRLLSDSLKRRVKVPDVLIQRSFGNLPVIRTNDEPIPSYSSAKSSS